MRQNSDGTGVVAAGDPVGWWLDKSATGATVTGSGSARPTLSATGFNSRQALVFNGSSTNLSNALYTATNSLSGMTRIAVCSNTNQLAFMSRVYDGGGDSFMLMNASWRTYTVSGANFSRTTIPGAVGSSAPAGVYADVFASSAMSMYALGASLPVTVVGTIAATTAAGSPALHIGSNIGANGFWNGPIAEYIIYNRALTRAELASVEAYLAQRWGISGVHAPATASSDPVGYWGDKSGNGRHAVQSLAGSRPLVGTENSRKALSFDGVNDKLSRPLTSTVGTNAITFLAVINHNLTGQPTFLTTPVDISSGNGGRPITRWASSSNDRLFAGISFADVATNYRSRSGRFLYALDGQRDAVSSGTHTLRDFANGALVGSGNITTTWQTTPQVLCVGSRDDDGVQYKGNICEVLVYDKILTTTERQRLERYLAARWGITLAPQVANADAQDWVNRVYSNGGTVSSATAGAVNTFCDSIALAGIRDRFYRLNLFCGTGLNAALVPLFRGPSLGGTQYGGTTDTNNAFVGIGTDYAETGASGGLTGNGSTKYLNTGLAPNALPSLATGHLAVYRGAGTAANQAMIAVRSATDYYEMLKRGDSRHHSAWGQTSLAVAGGSEPSHEDSGLRVASRTSATLLRMYQNGTGIADQTASVTPAATDRTWFVFAMNQGTLANYWGNATPSLSIPLRGYSIGSGMSDADVTAYTNAMTAFQTALGRA
jgi:hypothetical protein